MKYSILKHMRCPNTSSNNFRGEYTFTSFNELFENMINYSKWDDTLKQDLPMFSCTTFNYNIRADKAKPTYLFALDFDDIGNELDTALDYFSDYGYFIYTSYSHTKEHHKFRVIVKLDVDIQNNRESHMVFEILQRRLIEHNLILDSQCRDISRRFFLPSLNKMGDDPKCYVNEGKDVEIEEDLILAYERLRKEESIREQKIALQKFEQSLRPNKTRININKKIEDAQNKFLSNTGHQQLGNLISSLKFWGMEDDDIISWCTLNYNPSTGNCIQEIKGWMAWFDRRSIQTYKDKYNI